MTAYSGRNRFCQHRVNNANAYLHIRNTSLKQNNNVLEPHIAKSMKSDIYGMRHAVYLFEHDAVFIFRHATMWNDNLHTARYPIKIF